MFSYDKVVGALSSINEFKEIIKDPLFKEAILYSSPSLFSELNKYTAHLLTEKDERRIEKTLTKYLIRMGFRSTPFGLFSMCGMGWWGIGTHIAESDSFRVERSLDCELKIAICQSQFKNLCLNYDLKLITNQTIRKHLNTIKFQGKDERGGFILSEVEVSELIQTLLDLYSSGNTFSFGFNRISYEYDITESDYLVLISDLVSNWILIPEYVSDFEVAGPTPIGTILNKQFNWRGSSEIMNENCVQKLVQAFSSKDCLSMKEQELLYECIETLAKTNSHVDMKNIIRTNTYIDRNSILDCHLKEAINSGYKIFSSVTPLSSQGMSSFIRRFRDRYDTELVPLLVALDPGEGIGYGKDTPGGRHSLLHELKFSYNLQQSVQNRGFVLTPYEQIVLEKLVNTDRDKDAVIYLTAEDFPDFKQKYAMCSPSIGCMFNYVGKQNGKDIISDLHFAGLSACKMISRFADEHTGFDGMCEEIVKYEQEYDKDIIFCEISHLPKSHIGNILSRPCWRDYVCFYMTYPSPLTDRKVEVRIDDLYLRMKNDRLILWSKSLNKQIVPRITSAYNHYYQSSPLYQFLGDMQNGGKNESMGLTVNNLLELYPDLPRIMYENIVLTKRTWSLRKVATMFKSSDDLLSYLKNMSLPRYISYSEGDNQLVFDLESKLCLRVLNDLVRTKKNIFVEEYLPLAGDFESPGCNVELVVPLLRNYE